MPPDVVGAGCLRPYSLGPKPRGQWPVSQLETRYSVRRGSPIVSGVRATARASKAFLLDRNPIEGFDSAEEYQAFAERLAHKDPRPVLHAALSEDLPRSLVKFIKDNGASKQCLAKVEGLASSSLGAVAPTRAVQGLYVLSAGLHLTDDERKGLDSASTLLKDQGITVAAMIHCAVSERPAAKHRGPNSVRSAEPRSVRLTQHPTVPNPQAMDMTREAVVQLRGVCYSTSQVSGADMTDGHEYLEAVYTAIGLRTNRSKRCPERCPIHSQGRTCTVDCS